MVDTVLTLIDSVIYNLELGRQRCGRIVTDLTHSRVVDEHLMPEPFRVTIKPFEDEAKYLGHNNLSEYSLFTKRLFESNWDMWYTGYTNLIVPQVRCDRHTRRATLAFPHHCMSLMQFYARGPEATVYGFWRSLEFRKVPSDMVLFQRIAALFAEEAKCSRGVGIVRIGSYHKEGTR